jgi:hypothetical protein
MPAGLIPSPPPRVHTESDICSSPSPSQSTNELAKGPAKPTLLETRSLHQLPSTSSITRKDEESEREEGSSGIYSTWYGPSSILCKQVCAEEVAVEAKAGVDNNNGRAAIRESIVRGEIFRSEGTKQ